MRGRGRGAQYGLRSGVLEEARETLEASKGNMSQEGAAASAGKATWRAAASPLCSPFHVHSYQPQCLPGACLGQNPAAMGAWETKPAESVPWIECRGRGGIRMGLRAKAGTAPRYRHSCTLVLAV